MRAVSSTCRFVLAVICLEKVIDFLISEILRTLASVRRVGSAGLPLIYQIVDGYTDWGELRFLVVLYDLYPINKDVVGPGEPWTLCIVQRSVVSGPAFRVRELRQSWSEILQVLSRT